MAWLLFRPSLSLRSSSSRRKETEVAFIDSIEAKGGILRIVRGMRRRNGFPVVPEKFTLPSTTETTDPFSSSSGRTTTESRDNNEQSADKNSGTRARIYKRGLISRERTLRMKIKSKVPLAIDTLLDFDDSFDSPCSYVSGNMSDYETSRTPESAQQCQFFCSPVFRSSEKAKRFFGIVLRSTSPKSCASYDDDGKGLILTPTAQLRSYVKGVFNEVVDNLQGGSDEIEAIIAPAEFGLDEDTLYPFSLLSSPARPATIEMKAKSRNAKKPSSSLDDESNLGVDTIFSSIF